MCPGIVWTGSDGVWKLHGQCMGGLLTWIGCSLGGLSSFLVDVWKVSGRACNLYGTPRVGVANCVGGVWAAFNVVWTLFVSCLDGL